MTSRRMPTLIHVNQNIIRSNTKHQRDQPPITIRRGSRVIRAREVAILDADGELVATVIYRPDTPLRCGAKVWIELADSASVTHV